MSQTARRTPRGSSSLIRHLTTHILAPTAALLVLITMAGCLQMEHVLEILPDGGAVYSLNYSISEQAVTQFKEAARIRDDLVEIGADNVPQKTQDPLLLAFQNPTEKRIKTALEPYLSEGIVLDELELESRNNWRSVRMRIVIADMAELATVDFFKAHGFGLQQQDDKTWTFWRNPHIEGPPPPPPDKRTVREATPLLEGFRTKVKVTVPGRILRTSAQSTGQNSATWEFDFDKDGGALLDLQYQAFLVTFQPAPGAELRPLTYEGRSMLPRTPPE